MLFFFFFIFSSPFAPSSLSCCCCRPWAAVHEEIRVLCDDGVDVVGRGKERKLRVGLVRRHHALNPGFPARAHKLMPNLGRDVNGPLKVLHRFCSSPCTQTFRALAQVPLPRPDSAREEGEG